MARTVIPATTIIPSFGDPPVATAESPQGGSGYAVSAPTAIDQANGMYIAAAVAATLDRCTLAVSLTNGADKSVIIKAGVEPPAELSGVGDLTIVCENESSEINWINLEMGRFIQADGSVNIDFTAGATGTIEVVQNMKGG